MLCVEADKGMCYLSRQDGHRLAGDPHSFVGWSGTIHMTHTLADLPAGARLIANPNVVFRQEEDDTALLIDPDTGALHILNATAMAVWKLLDGRRDLGRIMADLCDEFDGMDAAAESQVEEMLNHLLAVGAVGVSS